MPLRLRPKEGDRCRSVAVYAVADSGLRKNRFLILELRGTLTIVIVTHNMQQAGRVSEATGFFLLGDLIEFGVTRELFTSPRDKRTEDYITGRFG